MTTLDDIVDTFELLEDWDQRYEYLMELGEKLPVMPDTLKTDDNKVRGCMSQVWVSAWRDEADPGLVRFYGECDTSIIKGVLALLIQLSDSKMAQEIEQLNIDEMFGTNCVD